MAKDIGKTKVPAENIDSPITLEMFYNECKRRKIKTGMILDFTTNPRSSLNNYSIFIIMLQFVNEINDHSYKSFKSFSNNLVTPEIVKEIAEGTKLQASSKLWHCMRQGRVTGSRIHEVVNCNTEDGTLVQSILGGYKVPETKANKKRKTVRKASS